MSEEPPPFSRTATPRHLRGRVWHYTSIDALESIVGSNLWRATAVASARLNDHDELTLGMRGLWSAFRARTSRGNRPPLRFGPVDEEVEELLTALESSIFSRCGYVVSFSLLGDDNSLWDRYARPDGVAIAWRANSWPLVYRDEALRVAAWWDVSDDAAPALALAWEPYNWTRVIYNARERAARLDAALVEAWEMLGWGPEDLDGWPLWREGAAALLAQSVASFKSEGFRSEQEVRYVVRDPAVDPWTPNGNLPVHVELTGGANSPFVTDALYADRRATLPIAEVRLGPACGADETDRLRGALATNYAHVPITKSTSTLRF